MGETYFHVDRVHTLCRGKDMTAPTMKWNGNMDQGAIEGVSKLIKKNGIEIVDFKFNDLPGLWQHFSIP